MLFAWWKARQARKARAQWEREELNRQVEVNLVQQHNKRYTPLRMPTPPASAVTSVGISPTGRTVAWKPPVLHSIPRSKPADPTTHTSFAPIPSAPIHEQYNYPIQAAVMAASQSDCSSSDSASTSSFDSCSAPDSSGGDSGSWQ